jgi:hypothetical protein
MTVPSVFGAIGAKAEIQTRTTYCKEPPVGGKEKLGSSIVFKKTVAKCPTVKLNIAGIIPGMSFL